MSLRVDDRSGRSRSKSPGGGDRDRSRSRSNVRAPQAPVPLPSKYDYASPSAASKPHMPGAFDDEASSPKYEVRSPQGSGTERSNYFASTSSAPGNYGPLPTAGSYPTAPGPGYSNQAYPPAPAPGMPYPKEGENGFTMGDYKDFPPNERPGYYAQQQQYSSNYRETTSDRHYESKTASPPHYSRQNSYDTYPPQPPGPPKPPQPPQAPRPPQAPPQQQYQYHTPAQVPSGPREPPHQYQYAEPHRLTYSDRSSTDPPQRKYSQSDSNYRQPQQPQRSFSQSAYSQNAHDQYANAVDITPYDKPVAATKPRPSMDMRSASGGLQAGAGLMPSMNRLSVSGAPKPIMAGELPPASPLLEAYRGTYQQMSPMPLALRPDDEEDLSDFEPLTPTVSKTSSKKGGKEVKSSKESKSVKIAEVSMEEKKEKRVKVYDPEEDAKTISKALSHSRVNSEAICDILPVLSHDQIMYLRKEYKKQVKVQGKGVNLSKHLKTKLPGNFGKAAYVTALGRWESEGYWANFFYQSHESRRELLIESLMGRTNAEIWNIKDEFKDKRYSDDLVKCMEKELKMDKFRTAVLLVLDEKRQEEQDVYPVEYRNKDVETLHKALTAPKGGESTMLEIIVLRSDGHLREVLKAYERVYQDNFPRAALKKSNNLVGEVIAHILNGVINKPARDALLLRHAIQDVKEKNKDEELRYELLISRLIRFHWDKLHLMRVKKYYADKYGNQLEEDIEGATKGDLADFLCQLCQVK